MQVSALQPLKRVFAIFELGIRISLRKVCIDVGSYLLLVVFDFIDVQA